MSAMDGFVPVVPKVDPSRFELRTTPSGATVIVPKGERWVAPAAAAAPAAAGAASGKAGKKGKGKEEGGDAAAAVAPLAAATAAIIAAVGGAGTADAPAAPAAPKTYKASTLSLEERFALCRSVGEECIQEEELMAVLKAKAHPICYDGFEPSGRMHIAQGIYKAILVNRLTAAGCVFKFWVADWFALLNNKMGGDLKKIKTVGRYMIEVWRAAGMDMDNVEFLWASEEINAHANEYWLRVMDIARRNTVTRIQRCCTIMGRKEGEELSAAQIFYPAMQAADVFFLKADICQLGMDQRKVNVLAREYCDAAEPKIKHKPIILSHHMMAGLKEGQEKMSKSDPDSAIFMEDSEADVKRKIRQAFCPAGVVEGNPVLDWVKYIVFAKWGSMTIKRKPENGGDKTYATFEELVAEFLSGALHPGDLKAALTDAINALLQPVRDHFASGEPKKLLEQVRAYRVTR